MDPFLTFDRAITDLRYSNPWRTSEQFLQRSYPWLTKEQSLTCSSAIPSYIGTVRHLQRSISSLTTEQYLIHNEALPDSRQSNLWLLTDHSCVYNGVILDLQRSNHWLTTGQCMPYIPVHTTNPWLTIEPSMTFTGSFPYLQRIISDLQRSNI